MEAQNVFAGCTIETEDEQIINVIEVTTMENHPNISGTAIVMTDSIGNPHYFGAFEMVYPV